MIKLCKLLSCTLMVSMLISSTIPALGADTITLDQSPSQKVHQNVIVSDDGITINGLFYTPVQFEALLSTAQTISPLTANPSTPLSSTSFFIIPGVAAGTYFIPGVGEVIITVTGAVIVAGVAIKAGSWASKKVISYFEEHTKNKRKSTHDKHTKPRPGRDSEKKKDPKKGWKPRT